MTVGPTPGKPATVGQDDGDTSASVEGDLAGGPTILVCEDDYLIRLTTAEILREDGYVVFDAATGRQALDLLDRHKIDLLMADIGLPDMTGVDLADRARKLRPTLPLLFATGHGEVENLPATPVMKIAKPFTEDMLREALAALLRPPA